MVARSSLCLVAGVGCAKLKGARGARHNDSLSTSHARPQPTLSTRSPHRQSPPLPEASAHPVPVLRVKIARASAARRQGRGREARQTPPCRYAGWHAIRFFGRRGDRPVTPLEPVPTNPRARSRTACRAERRDEHFGYARTRNTHTNKGLFRHARRAALNAPFLAQVLKPTGGAGHRRHMPRRRRGRLAQRNTSLPWFVGSSTSLGWCDPHHGFISDDSSTISRSKAAVRCQHAAASFSPARKPQGVKARVHLVGCVREAAAKLTSTMFPLLSALAIQFAAHEVSIYENDSADKTRDVLLQWLSQPSGGIHARSLMLPLSGEIASRYPERTDRIAHCRNTLMRHALQRSRRWHGKTASAFVVVLDLDCKRPVAPTPLAMAVMRCCARVNGMFSLAIANRATITIYGRCDPRRWGWSTTAEGSAGGALGSCDAYEMRSIRRRRHSRWTGQRSGHLSCALLLRKERRKENHKKWWQHCIVGLCRRGDGGWWKRSAAPCMYDGECDA